MKAFWIAIVMGLGVLIPAQQTRTPLSTYAFEQISRLQQTEKRHTLVFIHTDWCRYCQTMQHTTFKDESLVRVLNSRFYFISFNAEERKDIYFLNRSFSYRPTGSNTGLHELAAQLGTVNGSISFPVLCILNSDYEIVFQYSGFMSAKDLKGILEEIK